MSIYQCLGGVIVGPPAPSGPDQQFVAFSAMAQNPGLLGLFAISDATTASPTGTSNIAIASVALPTGALSPALTSPGVNGNIRGIRVRAFFQGANNSNAKTVGIAFGAAANVVARCALTISVASTAVLEAIITVDSATGQTANGWGIAATSATGGTLTGDVMTQTALTQNMGLAQSIYFTAVAQTSASDISLVGYEIAIW